MTVVIPCPFSIADYTCGTKVRIWLPAVIPHPSLIEDVQNIIQCSTTYSKRFFLSNEESTFFQFISTQKSTTWFPSPLQFRLLLKQTELYDESVPQMAYGLRFLGNHPYRLPSPLWYFAYLHISYHRNSDDRKRIFLQVRGHFVGEW